MLSTLSCNTNDEAQMLNESETYYQNNVKKYLLEGPVDKKDENIHKLFPFRQNDKYLGFLYYALRTKRGVELNQLDQALLYVDSAEHIYSTASDLFQEKLRVDYLDFLIHKGNILFAQKKYILGYDTFFKVLQLIKKYPYKDLENVVYYYMGINSYKQKVYDKAVEYFKDQLISIDNTTEKNLSSTNRFFRRQQALSNIALSYTKLQMHDSASLYYTKALDYIDNHHKGVCNSDQYNACRAVVLGNFAKIFLLKNQPDSAIKYYNESIHLTLYRPLEDSTSGRDVKDGGMSLIQLGDIYRSKGDLKNFKKTVEELNKWYDSDINYIFNLDEYRLGYLRQNAAYHEIIGDTENAYHFLKQYSNARDSIAQLETISKEKNLSVALEIKTREEEVKTLTLSNKLSRIYVWSAVIIALLITVVAILFFRSGQKSKKNNLLLQSLNNEIKQQQKETQYAYEQAMDANREKDKLLHVIVHDLRNPLSGISSLADVILEDESNLDVQQTVEVISKASKRSLTMVNELLQSVENQPVELDLTRVSLNRLAEEVLMMFKYRANEKKIKLELKQPTSEIIVFGDSSKLMRVVSNLLHNAIKFSNENTRVTMEVANQQNSATIAVIDNGIGMNEKVLNTLLEGYGNPVRKGTEGEKGFGIGWKICQQIVKAHHGNITISSKEGKGTTVTVQLKAIT